MAPGHAYQNLGNSQSEGRFGEDLSGINHGTLPEADLSGMEPGQGLVMNFHEESENDHAVNDYYEALPTMMPLPQSHSQIVYRQEEDPQLQRIVRRVSGGYHSDTRNKLDPYSGFLAPTTSSLLRFRETSKQRK